MTSRSTHPMSPAHGQQGQRLNSMEQGLQGGCCRGTMVDDPGICGVL